MKKLLAYAALFAVVALTSCKYDDDDLWNSVHGLENRVAKLEELCKQMNTNISSLQTIVTALQNNVYVTGTTPLMKDGKEIGYTITFSKGNPITIYHGKDGQDGEDGITPTISVKKDTDGVYYWTLNGEFIVVDGGKIKAEGKDGTNGTNGTTPQFKIENDYWFISYDDGDTWTQLGKATGEDGKDGQDGVGGDSMFSGVDYETSTDYVIFTLSNGTQIKLPTWSAFEALQRLCNETNTNLSALQTIVTALQNNDYITSVDPLTENGKVVGYTIKFAKSNPIVIYNGKDGADGNTPVIGVKKDTDGIYYWTLDGEFIVVDGQKIKAQGTDGNNGADGSDGVTPKLEIREGYWWISYDNGTNWTQLGKATGEDGKDADSIKITQDENNVYFELADGTVITISKTGQSADPNIIQFEDALVKAICITNWDKNEDGALSYEEAAAVTTIGTEFSEKGIYAFNELQYFTGLTSIPNDAFLNCNELLSIKLPDNIISINVAAFRGCASLKKIHIPANVESIKLQAFYGCISLISIDIPASVKTIQAGAFSNCRKLASVTFEKGSQLKTIGEIIPSNITKGAFTNCTSLTFIEIPASVETIEAAAFKGCSSLTTITFEKDSQLKIIGGGRDASASPVTYYGAFCSLKNLTTLDMSECTQVEEIGEGAFSNNSELQIFRIGTSIPPTCDNNTFYHINSNSVLKVPSGCINAYKAASGWKNFASITGLDE
ncbi:PL29 family lyase N-terminal domain-containing protein [Alistipes putredinis]|uniref:PL29 family lyase N-terminal domain-containing protein n=1 Tax=Alistipes putredinis TaxID=28117 RepID=UPI003A83E096